MSQSNLFFEEKKSGMSMKSRCTSYSKRIPYAKSTVRKQSPTVVTTLDLNAVQMLGASNPHND